MGKYNFIGALIFFLITCLFIYFIYLNIKEIYSYYFVYRKCEGKILDYKLIREQDEDGVWEYKYYLIEYTTINDNKPRKLWIKIDKNLKTNSYITFRYNPNNPDKILFGTTNYIIVLIILCFLFLFLLMPLLIIFLNDYIISIIKIMRRIFIKK